MPVLKNEAIKSLTSLCLPERHETTLDEFHVLIQWFPKAITDLNALELEFLEYLATPDHEFPVYFEETIKAHWPMHIYHIWHENYITFGI